jgi:hypothetical protein
MSRDSAVPPNDLLLLGSGNSRIRAICSIIEARCPITGK